MGQDQVGGNVGIVVVDDEYIRIYGDFLGNGDG